MPQICVLNESGADDTDVAFAVKACDIQLREHFCPRYPGVAYQPVNFFTTKKDLPTWSGISLICRIIDTIDVQGAAAYHGFIGVPLIKIDRNLGVLSVLMSHEILEESADPLCMERRVLPGGQHVAYEVCDPLQGWTYPIATELFGDTRQIAVSAFVTDAWFGVGVGPCSFSDGRFADLKPGELAPGGYMPEVHMYVGGGAAERRWGHSFGRLADKSAIRDRAWVTGSRFSRIAEWPP